MRPVLIVVLVLPVFITLAGLSPTAPGQASPLLYPAPGMLPPQADQTRSVALFDVDLDGDPDLLAGNHRNSSRLYLNDGTGRFTICPTAFDSLVSFAVATGDVDGDGDLDVVAANFNGRNRLVKNAGGGSFPSIQQLPPSQWGASLDIALADVDGDGDPDVIVANANGQNRLLLNNGSGQFMDVTTTQMPPDTDLTTCLATGDVDGDGDVDLVCGNANLSQNRLYLNDGFGTFSDATSGSLPPILDWTQDVLLRDVDGDGHLDIIAGNQPSGPDTGRNRLLLNDGAGIFTEMTGWLSPPDTDRTNALAWGDVDGDGDPDLAVGNAAFPGSRNRIYLNQGQGQFTDAALETVFDESANSFAIALQDVDADADLDVVIGNGDHGALNRDGQQNRLLLNDGTGNFTEASLGLLPRYESRSSAAILIDVDGDEALDVLVGSSPGQNRLLTNDGHGRFVDDTSTRLPPDNEPCVDLAAGDVDGDGDPDLVVANEQGTSRLLVNDGGGTFSDVTGTQLPPTSASELTTEVAMGDIDGDGDLDFITARHRLLGLVAPAKIHLNDGSGTFADVSAMHLPPLPTILTRGLELGDVDGDSDLDLVIVAGAEALPISNWQDRLLINNGTGVFVDATSSQFPPDSNLGETLALGDVEGDGDLDVLIGNGQSVLLYTNDGGGIFVDATPGRIPPGVGGARRLMLHDLDGDLDLDVVGRGFDAVPLFLWLNDGSGNFVDASATGLGMELFSTQPLDVGDVDGDGDDDLLVASTSQDFVLVNRTRQLSPRALPRWGKPLILDLTGPPGEFWMLLGSLGTSRFTLPSWGTLRLDPSDLVVLELGVFDFQGSAVLIYGIPSVTGPMIEATVNCQALTGFAPRLGNLQPLHFTGF